MVRTAAGLARERPGLGGGPLGYARNWGWSASSRCDRRGAPFTSLCPDRHHRIDGKRPPHRHDARSDGRGE